MWQQTRRKEQWGLINTWPVFTYMDRKLLNQCSTLPIIGEMAILISTLRRFFTAKFGVRLTRTVGRTNPNEVVSIFDAVCCQSRSAPQNSQLANLNHQLEPQSPLNTSFIVIATVPDRVVFLSSELKSVETQNQTPDKQRFSGVLRWNAYNRSIKNINKRLLIGIHSNGVLPVFEIQAILKLAWQRLLKTRSTDKKNSESWDGNCTLASRSDYGGRVYY